MKHIAILGAGNMGGAIAESLNGAPYKVTVTAHTQTTLDRVAEKCPEAAVTLSNADAVADADFVVLCVKPWIVADVFKEILGKVKPGAVIISVVAAMPTVDIAASLNATGFGLQIFRVIPNTAIRLGKSATFIAPGYGATDASLAEVVEIFDRSGRTFVVKESEMGACTALSSCGIAYFLRFIRAAAEGGVELGLRAKFAHEVAAATAEGAAALVLDGGHPEAEIDKVTTPGGLTIKGLNAMEEKGFTAAVVAALKASMA